MKVRMYMDIWNGSALNRGVYTATTDPYVKSHGVTRLAFDVHVPDDLIHQPDRVVHEVSKVELVVDHNEGEE